MLQQNPFPGTADSDQSFSENEDIDVDSYGNCISLSHCEEKEGGSLILSQLEKIQDVSKANSATKCNLLVEPTGIALRENEVEIPSFGVEGGLSSSVKRSPKSCSNEDMITDDEDDSFPSKFSISANMNKAASKGKAKRKFSLGCYLQKNESPSCFTPKHEFLVPKMVCKISENSKQAEGTSARDSAANDISDTEEDKKPKSPIDSHVELPRHGYYECSMAELLDGLHERLPTGLVRENKKCKKGGQRMQSVMKRNIATVDEIEVSKNGYSERSMAELLDGLHRRLPTNKCRKGQRMQSVMKRDVAIVEDVEVPRHGYPERSMAELLDGLQERLPTRFLRENKKGGQRMPSVMKRDIAIVKDSEDESNSMDSDSRGEEEENSQNLKVPLPERKRQTLLDCFQEILDASPWRDRDALAAIPNPLGLGLFGRLKQIMQNEKEREVEFMNNLQTSERPLSGIARTTHP